MASFSNHRGAVAICMVILGLGLCEVTEAVEFAGGTGDPNDPYQIATAEQLQRIIRDVGKYYILTADIDYRGTAEGLPLAASYDRFEGVLDGNFHALKNVVIEAGAGTPALLPELGGSGIIRNLTVENCFVSGDPGSVFGFLCGTNHGQIVNCRVVNCAVGVTYSGYRIAGDYDLGALVAINKGLIEDCRADYVTITCRSQSLAGGLVGRNLGIVRRCTGQGSMFGSGCVGGLVGSNSGDIEECFAGMTVVSQGGGSSGSPYYLSPPRGFGGLVGCNQGRIRDCYAVGSILASGPSGGLVGQHRFGEIARCYSTAVVLPPYQDATNVGPLVGEGDAASVRNCYYLSVPGWMTANNAPGTALSFSEMTRRESYAGWAFFDEDPTHPWLMPGNGRPRLACEFQQDIPVVAGLAVADARRILEEHGWQVGEIRSDYSRQIPADRVIWTFPSRRAMPRTPIDIVVSQGTFDWSAISADPNAGTEACPLQIRTAGQLEALRDFVQIENKHIELTADIDMAGRVLSEPLLGAARLRHDPGVVVSLQGNCFEIRNLTARSSGLSFEAGLVGRLAQPGRIVNLGLTHVTITCPPNSRERYSAAGALAGISSGLIQQCYAGGFVSGTTAGGLVAGNYGTIGQCFADVLVAAEKYTGGLVGNNWSELTDSYALGAVVGTEPSGGLVGMNYGGSEIRRCYATGSVINEKKSQDPTFQIVGLGAADRIVDCYYRVPSEYKAPAGAAGTPLFDAQMRRRFSFRNWDFWGVQTDGFEDIWFMPTDSYPLLTWQWGATGLSAVPPVVGLSVDEALSLLQSAGVVATVRYEYDDRAPASHVVRAEVGRTARQEAAVEVVASLGPYDWSENPGDGSEDNLFAISLVSQLFSLAGHPELWDRHFILTADLDLGWTSLERALIAADVNSAEPGFQGMPFNGTFDGAAHTLTDLTIYGTESYLGLFGALGPSARIAHLYLDNVCLTGADESEYVGPVAGISEGVVEDCHTSGWVSGGQYVGPFVGRQGCLKDVPPR